MLPTRFLFSVPILALLCGSGCDSGGEPSPAMGSGGTGPGVGGLSGTGSASAASGGAEESSSGGSSGGASAGGTGGQSSGGTTASGGGTTTEEGLTSTELTASWDSGWNLGNSLDVPDGETAWGNPAATAPLFSAVAAAGFDVVRIPVTWSNYTGAAPDYVIDATFMARVAEVVDLVNAAGMDAIINIHHDGADEFDGPEWLSLNDENGDVTDANNQAVEARFVKVWTQIAMHFKDHGENLVFESMNEIHDEYDPPVQAYYDIINHLNQTFVDLVRSTGGKNATRHLVVPGYNTNVDYTVEGFVKPTDTLADHLILSIHYYDPYTYSITAETHTWGVASPGSDDFGQEAELIAQFEKLKTAFTTQGTPMIMGEYGAPNQDGYADYRRYYVEYVTKVATDNGVVPVYWDNGGTGSGADNFALIDRNTFQVTDQNVLDALMRAATSSYTVADIALPTP